MSYAIEYKRQFIRSAEGLTPCWLAGDNNVYEGTGRDERRVREWCCFHNLVGVTEQDILDSVQSSLGGYGQHWMRNGKWVNDTGLIRWIKSGCRAASTIEDILSENPHLHDIHCYVSVWENHINRRELDYYVSSSAEFDRWICLYRKLHRELTAKGCSVYPVIFLGPESRYRQPDTSKNLSEKYILKRKGLYLTEVMENSSSWSNDIQQAAILTGGDVVRLRAEYYGLRDARAIHAEAKERVCNFVIMFEDGQYSGQYVKKRTKSRLVVSPSIEAANHYPTTKAAEAAMAKIQLAYGNHGNLVVRTHTKNN